MCTFSQNRNLSVVGAVFGVAHRVFACHRSWIARATVETPHALARRTSAAGCFLGARISRTESAKQTQINKANKETKQNGKQTNKQTNTNKEQQ